MSEPEYSIRSSDLSWTPTDTGTVIILDLRTSKYLSLNSTGALLWTKLSGGATTQELCGQLSAEYGVPHERAEADVSAFLNSLRQLGFLTQPDQGAA